MSVVHPHAQAVAPDRSTGQRVRELVTPEGVDLRVVLATASERASAFLLDFVFIVLSLVALTLVILGAGLAFSFTGGEYLGVLWLLGFFFLRVFYFTAFEMTARAATPGKRLLGIRVARRDGGALSADAVFARNAMRELEVFLPLTFVTLRASAVDLWISLAALVWCGVFTLFPLFNADRLRIGDLVAGTWVVHAPKRMLGVDLAASAPPVALSFDRAALDAYGIHELSVLEDVLRRRDPQTLTAVAARIRARIGWAGDTTPDAEFLAAYYAALRGRLEGRLLFGRRKRDKFDVG
jgi:uncharacterized RDD family membrane protein YckC